MKSWTTKLDGAEFKIMRLNEDPPAASVTDTPERIAAYIRAQLPTSTRYSPDSENFGIVLLNTRRRPIGMEIISNGTLDTILIHARQVFRPAIVLNAAALVLWHNHPSGDPSPSEADIKVTRDLIRAGQLLKIEILDHVILGQSTADRAKDYSSLKELGYFYS